MRNSIAASLVILAAACASTAESEPMQAPPELTVAAPAMLRAWQGDDVNAFRPLYADNVVVEANGERYSGWTDVRTRWIEPALPVMSDFRSTDVVFERAGNDIIERGSYSFRLTSDGRTETVSGAFAQRWQRHPDGTWKVVSVRVE